MALLLNLYFDHYFIEQIIDSPTSYDKFYVTFLSGNASAFIVSALLFSYVFRRRLALTLAFLQFITLISDTGYLVFNMMMPSFDARANLLPQSAIFFKVFFLGFIEGLTSLLLTLLGPLLVAASFRKTYEITMGGTMIAATTTIPIVLGVLIGSIVASFGVLIS